MDPAVIDDRVWWGESRVLDQLGEMTLDIRRLNTLSLECVFLLLCPAPVSAGSGVLFVSGIYSPLSRFDAR